MDGKIGTNFNVKTTTKTPMLPQPGARHFRAFKYVLVRGRGAPSCGRCPSCCAASSSTCSCRRFSSCHDRDRRACCCGAPSERASGVRGYVRRYCSAFRMCKCTVPTYSTTTPKVSTGKTFALQQNETAVRTWRSCCCTARSTSEGHAEGGVDFPPTGRKHGNVFWA